MPFPLFHIRACIMLCKNHHLSLTFRFFSSPLQEHIGTDLDSLCEQRTRMDIVCRSAKMSLKHCGVKKIESDWTSKKEHLNYSISKQPFIWEEYETPPSSGLTLKSQTASIRGSLIREAHKSDVHMHDQFHLNLSLSLFLFLSLSLSLSLSHTHTLSLSLSLSLSIVHYTCQIL